MDLEQHTIDEPRVRNLEPSTEQPRLRLLVAVAAALVVLVGAAGVMMISLLRVDRNTSPGAGSVDVGFAQDMAVHHLQAVTLAGWARDHSTDPAIRTLAVDIESTQLGQVGTLHGWLDLWNQPISQPGGSMAWMPGPGRHGHTGGVRLMPGMVTQQEITRLRSLTGRELDVYVLQLILRHHAGGAPMTRYAAEHANLTQVRALAHSIVTSQTAEVDTIKATLAERGAQPLP